MTRQKLAYPFHELEVRRNRVRLRLNLLPEFGNRSARKKSTKVRSHAQRKHMTWLQVSQLAL